MKTPGRIDCTPQQVEELLNRIDSKSLTEEDWPLISNLIRAIIWMNGSLQEKNLSIRRLRAIFGIKTESARKLLEVATGKKNTDKETSGKSKEEESGSENNKGKNSKGKHGHKPASVYTEAKLIRVAHQALKKGNRCPDCLKGKLFQLKPGSVIRIVGQPWLQVKIYQPERLRCPVCGKIFTALLPTSMATRSRSDHSARAIVSLLKYRGGIPFYRQEQMQEILGTPISASEIWQMTEEVANVAYPIYAQLCREAAQAKVLQNDDTKAQILDTQREIKQSQNNDERTGIFTTALLATLESEIRIGLFFTGRKHAGENLNALLDKRSEMCAPPIQQCDALSRNLPKDHNTHLANCLAHARRKFYELVEVWPRMVIKVIGFFSTVFSNDHSAPKDPHMRLEWHQEKSASIMSEMKDYCSSLLAEKVVEPNSSLGKAITYLNNHWEAFTLFLRIPGVPLTNNADEQLIKRAVLNRKNAYFFRNETGAKIADILMSVIETCGYNKINPLRYLVAIQRHKDDVRHNPALWLPWVYENRLKKLQPP